MIPNIYNNYVIIYISLMFKFGGSISVTRLRIGPELGCGDTTRSTSLIYGLRYSFLMLLFTDLYL